MQGKERQFRLWISSETWRARLGKFVAMASDGAELDPARGQTRVLWLDGDDIGPAGLDPDQLSEGNDAKPGETVQKLKEISKGADDRQALEQKAAVALRGWDAAAWEATRRSDIRKAEGQDTA